MSGDTESKLEYFFLLPALRCFARRYALHPEDKVMAKCLQHIVHSMNFVVGPPIREAFQETFRTHWKPDTADTPDNFKCWLNRLDDELRRIPVTAPSIYGGNVCLSNTSEGTLVPVNSGPIGWSDANHSKVTKPEKSDKAISTIEKTAVVEETTPTPIKKAPPLFTGSAESMARAAENIANGNKAASITDPLPTPATLNQRGNRRAHPTAGLSAVAVQAVQRRHVNPRQKAALNRLMMSAHQTRYSTSRSGL
jgi:hypothetical protein